MGLEITAAGKLIAWLHDEVDMFTFHLTVPAGLHGDMPKEKLPPTRTLTQT